MLRRLLRVASIVICCRRGGKGGCCRPGDAVPRNGGGSVPVLERANQLLGIGRLLPSQILARLLCRRERILDSACGGNHGTSGGRGFLLVLRPRSELHLLLRQACHARARPRLSRRLDLASLVQ